MRENSPLHRVSFGSVRKVVEVHLYRRATCAHQANVTIMTRLLLVAVTSIVGIACGLRIAPLAARRATRCSISAVDSWYDKGLRLDSRLGKIDLYAAPTPPPAAPAPACASPFIEAKRFEPTCCELSHILSIRSRDRSSGRLSRRHGPRRLKAHSCRPHWLRALWLSGSPSASLSLARTGPSFSCVLAWPLSASEPSVRPCCPCRHGLRVASSYRFLARSLPFALPRSVLSHAHPRPHCRRCFRLAPPATRRIERFNDDFLSSKPNHATSTPPPRRLLLTDAGPGRATPRSSVGLATIPFPFAT